MATAKGYNGSSTVEQLREAEKDLARLKRIRHLECNHDSHGGVVPLSDYSGVIRDAQKYPENSVIHPDCGAIFDATAFTEDQVFEAFFRIESMCHQIKMVTGANLKEKNKEELKIMMEYAEYLRNNLGPYYNSMVKALANNSTKKQRSERKIGSIGISPSLFS